MKIVCISSTEPGLIHNKVYDTDHFTEVERGQEQFTYAISNDHMPNLFYYVFHLDLEKASYGGIRIDASHERTFITYYRNGNTVIPIYDCFISLEEYRDKTIEKIIS